VKRASALVLAASACARTGCRVRAIRASKREEAYANHRRTPCAAICVRRQIGHDLWPGDRGQRGAHEIHAAGRITAAAGNHWKRAPQGEGRRPGNRDRHSPRQGQGCICACARIDGHPRAWRGRLLLRQEQFNYFECLMIRMGKKREELREAQYRLHPS